MNTLEELNMHLNSVKARLRALSYLHCKGERDWLSELIIDKVTDVQKANNLTLNDLPDYPEDKCHPPKE